MTQSGAASMRTALNTIAELLGVTPVAQETSSARREVESLLYCDWASLRYQHTQALRTLLAERYKPATANKMLAALRWVLLEARRLGLITSDDYAQAADIWPVALPSQQRREDHHSSAERPGRAWRAPETGQADDGEGVLAARSAPDLYQRFA
jgi:hypothetical protein